MKTFLALCLVLGFACVQSSFTPQWTSCEQPQFGWTTSNVTFDAAPVAGKNSTVTFCGTNTVWAGIHFSSVLVTTVTGLSLTIPLENVDVPLNVPTCYSVTFQIPQGHKDLNIHFGTIFLLKEFGCVDVSLNLENNYNKFLAF